MLVDVQAGAVNATASVHSFGATEHDLSIHGTTTKNQLNLQLGFTGKGLDKNQSPSNIAIGYYLDAMGRKAWMSLPDDATTVVRFEQLEFNGQTGKAVGSFEARLCLKEGHLNPPDPDNCKLMRGSFDTRLFSRQ